MAPKALQDLFHAESEELLCALEQRLIALEADPNDEEALNQIFRSVHTLKCSAGLVEIARRMRPSSHDFVERCAGVAIYSWE